MLKIKIALFIGILVIFCILLKERAGKKYAERNYLWWKLVNIGKLCHLLELRIGIWYNFNRFVAFIRKVRGDISMDLTGTFAGVLGENTDFESVKNAIEVVDSTFTEFLKADASEEERLHFFFDNEEDMHPNGNFFEIMDFWNEIEPYVWNRPGKDLRDYWIIRVMKEIETAWQVVLYNKILDQETEEHLRILRKISESIEDMPEKGVALQIGEKGEDNKIEVVYSLKYFDEQCYHPYRDFILQSLYQLLKSRGRLLITTNRDEYYMYEMDNFEWEMKKIANKEAYKLCMGRDDSAIRKGLIPGFVYDEVE